MPALIAASAVRTCFGDGTATFAALLEGRSGIAELCHFDAARLNVARGYPVPEAGEERPLRASRWLSDCVREALEQARLGPRCGPVAAIVGTGLRELRSVERAALAGAALDVHRLHFAAAVEAASPALAGAITLSNACSAGSHALALAHDLVELGEVAAAVAAGVDSMTASMLAMIGRVADGPAGHLRPFDADRTGTLLGEGAAAIVVVPDRGAARPLARLLGTGLSCDAHHETAPDADGIGRALQDAFTRAGRGPGEVDLVVAHGTGTLLNDRLEAELIGRAMADEGPGPLVTAVKGAIGHTSGASGLHALDVAVRCLRQGRVPPIVGLRRPLPEGRRLRLVAGRPVEAPVRLALVNSFGFGGVNAVTLLERAW